MSVSLYGTISRNFNLHFATAKGTKESKSGKINILIINLIIKDDKHLTNDKFVLLQVRKQKNIKFKAKNFESLHY